MLNEPIQFTEMEERLATDKDGAYRDSVLNRFNDQLAELKRRIDGGLAPADFDAAQKLNAALTAATAVVRKVWQAQHSG